MKHIPMSELTSIAADAFRGLRDLHKAGVVHGAMKPNNVLLDRGGTAFVADFGFHMIARATRGSSLEQDVGEHGRYFAPEQWDTAFGEVTPKTDVWGAACAICEAVSGHVPFEYLPASEVRGAVVGERRRPAVPEEIPQPLKNVLMRCFDHDQGKRPTAEELMQAAESGRDSLGAKDSGMCDVHNVMGQRVPAHHLLRCDGLIGNPWADVDFETQGKAPDAPKAHSICATCLATALVEGRGALAAAMEEHGGPMCCSYVIEDQTTNWEKRLHGRVHMPGAMIRVLTNKMVQQRPGTEEHRLYERAVEAVRYEFRSGALPEAYEREAMWVKRGTAWGVGSESAGSGKEMQLQSEELARGVQYARREQALKRSADLDVAGSDEFNERQVARFRREIARLIDTDPRCPECEEVLLQWRDLWPNDRMALECFSEHCRDGRKPAFVCGWCLAHVGYNVQRAEAHVMECRASLSPGLLQVLDPEELQARARARAARAVVAYISAKVPLSVAEDVCEDSEALLLRVGLTVDGVKDAVARKLPEAEAPGWGDLERAKEVITAQGDPLKAVEHLAIAYSDRAEALGRDAESTRGLALLAQAVAQGVPPASVPGAMAALRRGAFPIDVFGPLSPCQVSGSHQAAVLAVDWSPDGHLLASGDAAGQLILTDADTGEVVQTLDPEFKKSAGLACKAVAFHPDGHQVAVSSEGGTVTVFDVSTGAKAAHLHGHHGAANALEFSPDGTVLASAGSDRTLVTWNVAEKRSLGSFGMREPVGCMSWSGDSRSNACGGDKGTVMVTDVATGRTICAYPAHEGAVTGVAWDPEGLRIISGGMDGVVRVCQAGTGMRLAALNGHLGGVVALARSPDGQWIAACTGDRTVKVYDATAPSKPAAVLQGHGDRITGARFAPASPEGPEASAAASASDRGSGKESEGAWEGRASKARLATCSEDRSVRVWHEGTFARLGSGAWQRQETPWRADGHTAPVTCVHWSPDKRRVASASLDGTVRVFNSASGVEEAVIERVGGVANCVQWSPLEGTLIAVGSRDRRLRVIDTSTGKEQWAVEAAGDWVTCVAWSHSAQMVAAGGRDGKLKVFEGIKGTFVSEHQAWASGPVNCVAFRRGDRRVAAGGDDGLVRLFDPKTGAATAHVQCGSTPVQCLEYAPFQGVLAVGCKDNSVHLLAPPKGSQSADVLEPLAVLRPSIGIATLQHAQTAAGKSASLRASLKMAAGAMGAGGGAPASPDRKALLGGTASRESLLDQRSSSRQSLLAQKIADRRAGGGSARDLAKQASAVTAAMLGQAGQSFSSATSAGSADARRTSKRPAAPEAAFPLEIFRAGVRSLAWSSDARGLATACEDGVVRLWELSLGDAGSERVVAELRGHVLGAVTSLSWGGRRIVSGGVDHTVRVWDTHPGKTGQRSPPDAMVKTHTMGWDVAGEFVSLMSRTGKVTRVVDVDSGKTVYAPPPRADRPGTAAGGRPGTTAGGRPGTGRSVAKSASSTRSRFGFTVPDAGAGSGGTIYDRKWVERRSWNVPGASGLGRGTRLPLYFVAGEDLSPCCAMTMGPGARCTPVVERRPSAANSL